MKYNTEQCNIHKCNSHIYKDGLCRYHYDFYMKEESVKKNHNEFELIKNKKANFKLKLNYWFQIIIHYVFVIPMPFVEHFPLEHIFLSEFNLLRKKLDKIDVSRYENIINDFDIKENENIENFKRLLYSKTITEVKLSNLNDYLFHRDKLPSKKYYTIALLSLVLMFILLKINIETEFVFYGLSKIEFCNYFNTYFSFALTFTIIIGIGISIPYTYNKLIKRSYDLSLFEKVEDNIEFLNQLAFVRNRKDKGDFFATISGFLSCNIIISLITFLNSSSINWYTIIFFTCMIVFINITLLIYLKLVFYYPIVDSIKKKKIKILLFNPDNMGGMKPYHSFLFYTFLYNISIIIWFLILCVFVNKWYLFVFFYIHSIFSSNRGIWSLKMYYDSVRSFIIEKREYLDSLNLLNDVNSLDQANHLQHVHWTKLNILIKQICILIILPLAINNYNKILSLVVNIILYIWSYIQL